MDQVGAEHDTSVLTVLYVSLRQLPLFPGLLNRRMQEPKVTVCSTKIATEQAILHIRPFYARAPVNSKTAFRPNPRWPIRSFVQIRVRGIGGKPAVNGVYALVHMRSNSLGYR